VDEHVGRSTTLSELLGIFEKICQAVAFAHAQGVIHRDLNPQNIMVGPFGEVLVMDWGVAKVRQEPPLTTASASAQNGFAVGRAGSISDTAHGTVLGTPGYMAPEQARGEIERIDERTDVYALGAILSFLLTGQPPLPSARAGICVGQTSSAAEP